MLGKRSLAAFLALALAGLAGLPAGRWLLWRREANPILRGRILAEQVGCVGCHLGISGPEIPNPGSRWGSVPRFAVGNARMYVEGREEIEEFIRFGAPRTWLSDPAVAERLATQHLRMPAYEDRLTGGEIADLVSYVSAVEQVGLVGDEAGTGHEIAVRYGCLSCHGVQGSGGLPNPGSLGGFIPGFLGGNFQDMVQNEEEFRQWVLEGTSTRLAANPLIRFFWRRQEISMPAYREELEPGEVEKLWLWVKSMRAR